MTSKADGEKEQGPYVSHAHLVSLSDFYWLNGSPARHDRF